MRSITAANSIYMLSVATIFPVPIQLEGFMADAAWDSEEVDSAEIVKGVDGQMSAGFVQYTVPQRISLMPTSRSSDMFEQWADFELQAQEKYWAQGIIRLPATQRGYTMVNGILTRQKQVPDGHKTLQGRQFLITWDQVRPAPFL